jgi:hypothetical protein
MAHRFLRLFPLFAMLGLVAASAAIAQDCSGTITADEAMKAETALRRANLERLRGDGEAVRQRPDVQPLVRHDRRQGKVH